MYMYCNSPVKRYKTLMSNDITSTAPRISLRIGDKAPDFSARSTAGQVRMVDFRRKWLILFSHPADFTPVCTTEFVALARAHEEFTKRDCALMALSVDSLFSHFAWLRMIRDTIGVEVRFPIIEDPTMVIARAYGMIGTDDADSGSIRSTFFIDPAGTIRALTCYPANVGRSVTELLRTLDALQAVDQGNLAPADWILGEALLSPPSIDLDDVYSAPDATGWFLRGAKHG